MGWLADMIAECLEPNPPGFAGERWLSRQRLQFRALLRFCGSIEALRLLLWLVAWQLAAYTLSWVGDFGLRARTWLLWAAALWVWPWLIRLRRRELERLLAERCTGNR